jgi:hypothetical protein
MSIRLLCGCFLAALVFSAGAEAATFYVRNGGDDSADGRSPDTAWATINKVNSYSFAAGDAVLFHEGDTWSGQTLKVRWSGTSSNKAVVGAYYVQDGQAHVGFQSSPPVIDGADKAPSSRYNALVLVTGSRVRVQDLAIVNSEGRGITFSKTSSDEAVNLALSNTYDSAIKFLDSKDGVIAKTYVTDAVRVQAETGGAWSAAVSAVRSTGMQIRNNSVVKVFGEGININENCADAMIEQNFVFAARAAGIYADASPRPVIRDNIVIGTADPKYWRTSDAVGAGIAINNENYHYQGHGGSLSTNIQTTGAKIYDNLVAYTNEGIGIWGQLANTSFDNTMIYNNTLVDNDVQVEVLKKSVPMPGSQFINNILLSISPGTRDTNLSQLNGMVAKNNYLSQGDPGNGLSNAGNRYKGLQLKRMQGWRNVTDPSAISWHDFQLATGSSAIGAGDSTPLEKASSSDAYNLDFNRKPHNEPPDMGAIGFHIGKIPGPPVGLTTRSTS